MELRGRIVDWNGAKGWGFVDDGKQRVFLHRKEFKQRDREPAIGDIVRYSLGTDAKGRPCAKAAEWVESGPVASRSASVPTARGQFGAKSLGVLVALMLPPAVALYWAPVWMDWAWVSGWVAVMSLFTYIVYAIDKRKAQAQDWRTPESSLHFCELIGGWPGAFVAQRRLRHKAAKVSFQFWFWLIVIAWEYVAIDSVANWRGAHWVATAIGL